MMNTLMRECDGLDPRIKRTRQLLCGALRTLLKKKEFDCISVQDIAEAATLNRATFYAHYPDKFALLEELIRTSFLDFLEKRNVRFDGTCPSAFRAIILAVCDYLAEVHKAQSSHQLQFEPLVESTIINQVRLVLLEGFRRHREERRISGEMIAATASWAIYGAAKEWVCSEGRGSVENFADTVLELVQPIVGAGKFPLRV
jgi:AcrR family transcriptional regulator